MWSEVATAKKENRRELVLTGKEVGKKIEETGFDENIYDLIQLNFLEVSRVGLPTLSARVGQLVNLTSLVLHCNKLDEIPSSISKLAKLKFLDVSLNNLTGLPQDIGDLLELQTLNASGNKLTEFIDISNLTKLHFLDISNNLLKELPVGIDSAELKLLNTISAKSNEIKALPENLYVLPLLKTLDVSNNKIENLPPQLGECGKLREFDCVGNKLKDGRLMKLVNQKLTKAVLDYLRGKIVDPVKGKGKKGKKDGKVQEADFDAEKDQVRVEQFDVEKGLMIKVTNKITGIRPYIVCCIVRNLNFNKSSSAMKGFIKLQTKIHEGTCVKRQVATIATHDLEKLKGPLVYDAREPAQIMIHPLKKTTAVSAESMVEKLIKEGEEARKAKKRNTVSGTHKYLNLLVKHAHYPCIVDNSGVTISLPPITNSENSKVTEATRHVLVEVTGQSSLEVCKKVMDELIVGLLEMGVGQEEPPLPMDLETGATIVNSKAASAEGSDDDEEEETDEDQGATGKKLLIVEQVKVVDELNNLKVVYPSRTDLRSTKFNVIMNERGPQTST